MSNLKLASRKVRLQYLQVKSLKNCSNLTRVNEQKQVLRMLLLNPNLLFTDKYLNKEENWLYKYINNLNMSAKNDTLFHSAKRMLKNG